MTLFSTHQARLALLLFLCALMLNLLGNAGHSLWDRDEARFAEASREMLATGDWVVPRFNGAIRYDKPVLIYWLQGAAMRLVGVHEFAVRLPASLAGAGTVALVFLLALMMGLSLNGALVAALTTMLGALLLLIAKASTTDAVLTFTVVAALAAWWGQRRRGFVWWRHVAFTVALAASVLVKGPVGLMVVGLTIIVEWLWRWFAARRGAEAAPDEAPSWAAFLARLLAGVALFALLTAPWAWLVYQRTRDAPTGEFFHVAIGHHVVERSLHPLEGHRGPFFFYLLDLLVAIFPATALLLMGLRHGWRRRADPRLRFLWSWFVPGLVVFSLVSTKLPHYIAPLLPALALMIGLWWSEVVEAGEEESVPAWAWRAGAALMLLTGLAGGLGLPWAVARYKIPGLIGPCAAIATLLLLFTSVGGGWWVRRAARPAVIAWYTGMVLTFMVMMAWGLPALEPIRPARTLVRWIQQHAPAETQLLAVEYQEPSLVFYWGKHVEFLGKSEADKVLARLGDTAHPAALITTESRWQKILEKARIVPVSPKITVRTGGEYQLFQRGKKDRFVVVGNW